MESGLQDLAKLGSVNVPSGELCNQLGLSYRQLTEWDRRGALPHIRSSERAWREFSLWQVMGLKIAAECRERFGIPLARLRKPLLWMTGEEETELEGRLRDIAILTLWGRDSFDENVLDLFSIFTTSGNDGVAFGTGLEAKIVPRLCQRGWEEDTARRFVTEFIQLNYWTGPGCQAFGNLLNLLKQSAESGDEEAVLGTVILGKHLVPLLQAFHSMLVGFPTYLATDLNDHHFLLDSVTLAQHLRRGIMPMSLPHLRIEQLVLFRVNEPANAVLEACGFPRQEVVFDDDPDQPSLDLSPTEAEATVLSLMRERDFERIVILPKGGGSYQVTLRRELGSTEEEEIAHLLRTHDYQFLGVNRQDGQNVRVQQDVSVLVGPGGVTGKIPERPRGKDSNA